MSQPVGYLELLRRRPAYRHIWLGAVVSLAGDWFTLLALYSLLNQYTGSGEAVGLLLVARFLPPALLSPFAGMVADRYSRRKIMVAADVLRAITVLGFLFVRTRADVPLIYLLSCIQMGLSAFFDPAEQASIGSVVPPEEIVTATTMHALTWSAMLSIGALLGGAATELFGFRAAFCIDAATYLLSAFFISRAAIPHREQLATSEPLRQAFADVREGIALVARSRIVRRIIWVKTGWGLCGGGALALYAILGARDFKLGATGTTAIGILLASRGVGALIGPMLARRIGGDSIAWLTRAITLAFVVNLVAWLLFAFAPGLPLAALCLCIAHMGVSVQWTFSSSLLTLSVDDRLRGRVFSLDNMLYTLTFALSSWLAGRALDRLLIAPRHLMAGLALFLLVPIAVWWLLGLKKPAKARSPGPVSPS